MSKSSAFYMDAFGDIFMKKSETPEQKEIERLKEIIMKLEAKEEKAQEINTQTGSAKMTIKEVYNQLPKEDLGTERAKVRTSFNGDGIIAGIRNGWVLVYFENNGYPNEIDPKKEVVWIGNKPKTKMLYAYLVGWEDSDLDGMIYNVNRAEKHVGERHNYFIKWLPEDKFPPIEEEVGE